RLGLDRLVARVPPDGLAGYDAIRADAITKHVQALLPFGDQARAQRLVELAVTEIAVERGLVHHIEQRERRVRRQRAQRAAERGLLCVTSSDDQDVVVHAAHCRGAAATGSIRTITYCALPRNCRKDAVAERP